MPKTEIERLLDDLHSNLIVTAERLARQIDAGGSASDRNAIETRLKTIQTHYVNLIHAATASVTSGLQSRFGLDTVDDED